MTINGLAEMVKVMTGSRSPIRHIPYREAYGEGFEDMERRVPDLSKVRQLTGYQPRFSLQDILTDVIEHVRGELNAPTRAKAIV